jgi:cbb3-type cytochrome oxidase subunit 3
MIKEALTGYPHINLTLVALGIFVGVFFGMLIWIHRKNSKELYQQIANLPLEE